MALYELDVAVRSGRIVAGGRGLSPQGADAGLDRRPHAHRRLPEGFPGDDGGRQRLAGGPCDAAAVGPGRALDEAFEDALSGGVIAFRALPGSGNVIGGQGVVVKTRPTVVERMTVVPAPS